MYTYYRNKINVKEVIDMKIYDKEIYKKQESIRTTAIIIVVFLIGFAAGYFATTFGLMGNSGSQNNTEKKNTTIVVNN